MKNALIVPATRSAIRKRLMANPSPSTPHSITSLLNSLFPNGHKNLSVHSFIEALTTDGELAEKLESWRHAVNTTATEEALALSKPPLVTPLKADAPPHGPPKIRPLKGPNKAP